MAPWQSPWPLTRAHAAWSAMRSRAISATAALALRRDSADLFAVQPAPPADSSCEICARQIVLIHMSAVCEHPGWPRSAIVPGQGRALFHSCVPARAVMHYGADPAVPWYKRSAKAGHSSAPGQGFKSP